MEELIKTFYIDWKLLIAQAVNFVIVMVVLLYFGLKPLMKLMNERSKKIEDGLKNAELIEEKLKNVEQERQTEIDKGRKEGQKIINESEKEAENLRVAKITKTKSDAEKIVKDAKKEIEFERQKMIQEIKSELGELVLLASDKIASKTIDKKKHKDLIDNVIKELQKTKINN